MAKKEKAAGAFVLRIELGNAAMRSPRDVADALRRLAEKVEDLASFAEYDDEDQDAAIVSGQDGGLMDLNGNSVGKWSAK